MKLLFIASLFFTASAHAALNWDELQENSKYLLTSDIVINNSVTLKKGDAFLLQEFAVGEVPVLFYTFQNLQCNDATVKAEMVLFNPEPEDKTDDKSIGVELTENCKVEIYVENRHYKAKSAFEE